MYACYMKFDDDIETITGYLSKPLNWVEIHLKNMMFEIHIGKCGSLLV